jgi:hypothetical protein
MTSPNIPIVNASNLYINGFDYAAGSVGVSSGNLLTFGSGAARDTTNTNDIISNSNITINTSFKGVNGLDIGTLATDKVYALHIIGDSTGNNPVAALFSLSGTAPLLPSGYDIFRRIGVFCTTTVSSEIVFVQMFQLGTSINRVYYLVGTVPALTAGNATSFTAVQLQSIIPSFTSDREVYFNLTYASNSANNTVDFNVFGTNPNVSYSNGAVSTTISPLWLSLRNSGGPIPTFRYRTTSASDSVTMTIAGFKDYLE